jgi:hypothetical protein
MSKASEFKTKALHAKDIFEVIGRSGASYVFFWFTDGSVCSARRLPGENARVSARLEFEETMPCLDDCGTADYKGTTYEKGQELLRRIRKG